MLASIVHVGTDLADEPEVIRQEVIENYAKDLPPTYLDIVQHSDLSTLSWAPVMFRYPWNVVFGNLGKQNITVAGDAMHPMTPDLGQGGCLALEDAVVLGRYIGTSFVQNGRLVPKEIDRCDREIRGRKKVACRADDCRIIFIWMDAAGRVWMG